MQVKALSTLNDFKSFNDISFWLIFNFVLNNFAKEVEICRNSV